MLNYFPIAPWDHYRTESASPLIWFSLDSQLLTMPWPHDTHQYIHCSKGGSLPRRPQPHHSTSMHISLRSVNTRECLYPSLQFLIELISIKCITIHNMQNSLKENLPLRILCVNELRHNDQTHKAHNTVIGAVRWALIVPVTKQLSKELCIGWGKSSFAVMSTWNRVHSCIIIY